MLINNIIKNRTNIKIINFTLQWDCNHLRLSIQLSTIFYKILTHINFYHREVQTQEKVIKTLIKTIRILKTVKNIRYLKKKGRILLFN
jgi:hypothetical protein